ncbi:MAG: alcohol dehydrogenase catalytic domain-containing protein [Terriglobales bacterium]
MKALSFDGQLSLQEIQTPRVTPGSALIRVLLAGICGTDRQILKGYSGFHGIPGHEFVGEVVECDQPEWLDKRVVGEINIGCGSCEWCRRGLKRHCSYRAVMGIIHHQGAFAEFVTLPVGNLHEVPENIPDQAAVFIEPLAAAAEILEQMPVPRGTSAAVLGAGRLGLLVAQVLHNAGAQVSVIGRGAAKLGLARSLGLDTGLANDAGLRPKSFPLVVEATGSPQGLDTALRLVEPRGTVVMKSTFHQPAHFDTAKVVVDEITLLGSRCGNFQTALDLLKQGAIQVQPMISKVFPLEQGIEAFAFLDNPDCLKVLLANR